MENFTPVSGAIGGALIGLASVMFMALNGRVAGISGILGGLLSGIDGQSLSRVLFLIGLISGPIMFLLLTGGYPSVTIQASTPTLIIAGLLVGFGTRLGSGCTSGHGICGVSRLSPRSIVATIMFVAFGILTATLFSTLTGS